MKRVLSIIAVLILSLACGPVPAVVTLTVDPPTVTPSITATTIPFTPTRTPAPFTATSTPSAVPTSTPRPTFTPHATLALTATPPPLLPETGEALPYIPVLLFVALCITWHEYERWAAYRRCQQQQRQWQIREEQRYGE